MRQRVPFQRIGVPEARSLIEGRGVLLLDVRDAESFRRSHVAGAQNVSIANLDTILQTMARSMPILIYCYHGYASQEYAQIFSDFGFSEVYSLDGGYKAWSKGKRAAGRPVPSATLRRWLAGQGFSGNNVNTAIANGTTPLMKASHGGDVKIVRALIAAGSQVEARNADGNNALWLACVGNHLDIMDVLIEAGIDIDNRNDNGATSLIYAASSGKTAVVERLLVAGADISHETLDGFTALDMAATVECLTLLRNAARAQSGWPTETSPSPEIKHVNL
ncbi:MAG TPA: ankyrin repeat domain-containing protein [Methylocella sp.]|nr:ankyrin repeat domain-containing protein [Methylocella sp.]